MAGISYAPQAPINSSGADAPWRKLNAEAACSSTYFNRRRPPHTTRPFAHRRKDGEDISNFEFRISNFQTLQLLRPILRVTSFAHSTNLPNRAKGRWPFRLGRARQQNQPTQGFHFESERSLPT